MKQPRQRRALETRARILDAAEALFDARGFSKTGMSAIAEAAGLSAGGLYEWFRNKDEVLTAVAERHLDEVSAAVLARAEAALPDDLEAAIRLVLEAALSAHEARPRLHRFLYAEAPRPPALQAKLKAFDAALEGLIAERLAQEGLEGADGRLRAALIARAGQSLLHDFVLDAALPAAPRERLDHVVAALMRFVRD